MLIGRLGLNLGGLMRRKIHFEQLEVRTLMAADWSNAINNLDVNDSGLVTPLDVLLVANDINAHGMRALPAKEVGVATAAWIDVNAEV